MAELKQIPIDQLQLHPDNPRLRLRDDVVTQIAAEITRSGFGEEHALLVRPVNGHYQIISGHHRHGAAKRVGLESLPCWVREMDDDEAFMQLILSNTQGELSPLEEGHHAYHYAERGNGGRGKKGGLRDYARRLNKNPETLRVRTAAYHVYTETANTIGSIGSLLDGETAKTVTHNHLYEISKSPEDCWQPLVATMMAAAKPWTVRDTASKVTEIAKFNIPDRHASWLLRGQITDSYLRHGQPTPSAVERLANEADRVIDAIKAEPAATAKDVTEFRTWLVATAGGDSWDVRNLITYQRQFMAAMETAKATAAKRWNQGDWRSFVADLEDKSIALLLTDPPYGIDFQSNRKQVKNKRIANDNDAALPLEILSPSALPQDERLYGPVDQKWVYLISGFPAADDQIDRATKSMTSTAYLIGGVDLGEQIYSKLPHLDRDIHLAFMHIDKTEFNKIPELKAMSGSPVWLALEDGEDLRNPKPFSVIGVFIEYWDEHQAAIAVHIKEVLKLILLSRAIWQ